MSENERVIIALTEASAIADLWDAAMQVISDTSTELLVVFLHDERWHRAASLPFTREISQVGGSERDFTLQRAEQVLEEKASTLRKSIEERAESAGLTAAFQVLSETDQVRTRTLLASDTNIVVGPSALAQHPVFLELQSIVKRMILIESGDRKSGQD
jgi:hypothetical protein